MLPSLYKSVLTDGAINLDKFIETIHAHGAGVLNKSNVLSWKDGSLVAVTNYDNVTLADLYDYGDQRKVVIDNTQQFINNAGRVDNAACVAGRRGGAITKACANNILLYGDRGTGKSATVKAVCNEFADKRLRLVGINKKDALNIQCILQTLRQRGLLFVLFIDDLTFESNDDSFNELKTVLEGGVENMPTNVVIYATSNRRHFVKENRSDMPAAHVSDEVRAFDTVQEKLSLSDRFGLTLVFASPAQDEYLRIAQHIACKRGILDSGDKTVQDQFCANALRWEKWFNGRSPRTARQFVDWLEGNMNDGAAFPWE
jgi:predicted AAA+ superfamily ATPase